MNKEREEFEDWIKNEDPFVGNDAAPDCIWAKKYMWKAWQAAKAQAVPEGFVLIPKNLPDELNDQLWDFMTDNFVCVNDYGDSFMACDDFDLDKLYATLIEAQEPK